MNKDMTTENIFRLPMWLWGCLPCWAVKNGLAEFKVMTTESSWPLVPNEFLAEAEAMLDENNFTHIMNQKQK